MESPLLFRGTVYLYHLLTAVLVCGVLVYVAVIIKHFIEGETYSILFIIITSIVAMQVVIYIFLPYWLFSFVSEMFSEEEDIGDLFAEVSRYPQSSFVTRCNIILFCNVALAFSGSLSYMVLVIVDGENWGAFISSLLWNMLYFAPFIVVLSLSISNIEAHRLQADHFVHHIRALRKKHKILFSVHKLSTSMPPSNDSVLFSEHLNASSSSSCSDSIAIGTTLQDLNNHYYYLLSHFLSASEKRGKLYFSLLLIPLFILLTSIISYYEGVYDQAPFIGFTVMSLLFLFEIGFVTATVNETGNVVSRELSSFLLCTLAESHKSSSYQLDNQDIREMHATVACLTHAKIEIIFFGNFSLRSSTLLAILGSLVVAIIPAVVHF